MASKVIGEDIRTIAEALAPLSKQLEGKTILITGGAGFLGKYFIGALDYLNRKALKKPCTIISVDNFITGKPYWTKEGPHFKAIKHNVKEPLKIKGPVDYIIHAAGIASPKFYREYKLETIEVATFGTKNMLELAKEKKVRSMLFFSSSEVYGDPDPKYIPTPETYCGNVSCTGPRANYDESKRLGETLSVTYHEVYGVPVKTVRPFNIYGPGMRLDDNRVIPNFVAKGLNREALPVYGDGHSTRTFCYITDAITGFFQILLSDRDGEAFNLGSADDEISMKELAKQVAELIGPGAKIAFVGGINDAYANADPKRRRPDISKAINLLGYSPKVELREGLQRFIRWAREESSK